MPPALGDPEEQPRVPIVTPHVVAHALRSWAGNAASPDWQNVFDGAISAKTAQDIIRVAARIERHIPADDPRLAVFQPFTFTTAPGATPFLAWPAEAEAYLNAASPDWSPGRWFDGFAAAYRNAPHLTDDEVAEIRATLSAAVELERRGRRPVRRVTADGQMLITYVSQDLLAGRL